MIHKLEEHVERAILMIQWAKRSQVVFFETS